MEELDVIIIGGNVAGNYMCYLLARFGLKIAVIEEHEDIGLPFQCAGIVSQKLASLIDLPHNLVLNRVKIAKIYAPSGKFMRLTGEERPYIIDRVALDKLFYEKVKNRENIHYYLGEKFKKFEYVKDNNQKCMLITTNKRQLKARMLIGCDGPLSMVARQLGIINRILHAAQVRVKGDFNEDEAIMYFDPRWKELFGWVVPEGNHVYRIGIASVKNIARNFKAFLSLLDIDANEELDRQGGLIPYGLMNKVAFDNILLVGDSAGQVKATTGGGIVMLLNAAKHAARCIQKCFQDQQFSKGFIAKHYESPCKTTIGRQLKIHYLIRLVFEHFEPEDFDTFFQIVKIGKIERLISFYGDMDFPKSLLLKLFRMPIVLKFLLKLFKKNPNLLITIIRVFFKK